ncbi:MAG: hypothetical protein RLW62_21135 [Gammaproteobacteria bacterium]
MQGWPGLLETLLWVGLVAGLAWRYDAHLGALLQALRRRIEAGGAVKAGPFELGPLRALDVDEQRAKVARELSLLAPGSADAEDDARALERRYLHAEDLALRAVQAEFGVPLQRHVTGGRDNGFDAVFEQDGHRTVVAVVYLPQACDDAAIASRLAALAAAVQAYRWAGATLLLVLVYEETAAAAPSDVAVAALVAHSALPLVVRRYGVGALERLLGIADTRAAGAD